MVFFKDDWMGYYSVGLNARWPLWDKGRRSPARKPRK